jgi:GntR family transcriptional repressor for pyruvate dehydrogenase complex
MSDQTLVEPVRRSRLSRQIVLQLCELIREGRLRAGDRLPAERELAEQLRVCRSSLREALRTMELAGLVESHHGGGTYVRDAVSWDAVSPLALVLQTSGDTVGDLWEIRLIVEPEIAARAALRASDVDLAALAALLDRQEAALDREDVSLGIDRDFHIALAHASHNAVAVRVVELIGSLLLAGRGHFITSPERRLSALVRHREILAAVRSRVPEEARSAMLHHLQEVESYIVGALTVEAEGGKRKAEGSRRFPPSAFRLPPRS